MARMKCQHAARNMSAYLDGRLETADRRSMALHLEECPHCASLADEYHKVRQSLRSMPVVTPPSDLTTRLRIVASRERIRIATRRSWRAVAAGWVSTVNLWLDNLMYPLALPFAGGVVSAVMLFAVLVSGVGPQAFVHGDDVPTVLSTGATVRSTGPLSYTDEVEVDIIVDRTGRVVDYALPPGLAANPELRRSLENNLIFTQFYPATTFGLPTAGKVRLSFRKSHIEVKG